MKDMLSGRPRRAWASSRTAVDAPTTPPTGPGTHRAQSRALWPRHLQGHVGGSERCWTPPFRSRSTAKAHLAIVHSPAPSLCTHVPALHTCSRGEWPEGRPRRPGRRDLEGGADTRSRQLKVKGSLLQEHAGPSKMSSATNTPGVGTGTRGQGPGASRLPPPHGSVPSALSPTLSLSLRPSFFSFLCSASHEVWALPLAVSPGARGWTSWCQFPGSHIPPEAGRPLPRVCLSGSVRCLPGSPAVHWQKRTTRPRPAQPQRGQRQHPKPDTDLSCFSVFPKAPPGCWDHPAKQLPCLPSPRA